LKVVYEDFQKSVVDFAKNNPKEIRKNTEFRQKFNQLCLDLGVDPMVCKDAFVNIFPINFNSKEDNLVRIGLW